MPHTRTHTDTVYTFDELSDSAKETARNWMREGIAEDFASFQAYTVLEDAARLASMFGLNIRTRPVKLMNGSTRQDPNVHWAIYDRERGVSFSGSYAYKSGSVRAVAAEAPASWNDRETGETRENAQNAELNRIVRELADVQRRHFYKLTANCSHHSNWDISLDVGVECDHCGMRAHHDTDDAAGTVRELLEDFASWILAQLEAEYKYQMSDEQIDETIRANEYEFHEDGRHA